MNHLKEIAFLAGNSSVGYAAAILSAKVLPHFGRSFMQITPHSMLLVGIIGAVHHFASFYFSQAFAMAEMHERMGANLRANMFNFGAYREVGLSETKKLFSGNVVWVAAGNVVSAACLLGLTALAAKVNLISGGLSLAGAGALILTGVVGNLLLSNALQAFPSTKQKLSQPDGV